MDMTLEVGHAKDDRRERGVVKMNFSFNDRYGFLFFKEKHRYLSQRTGLDFCYDDASLPSGARQGSVVITKIHKQFTLFDMLDPALSRCSFRSVRPSFARNSLATLLLTKLTESRGVGLLDIRTRRNEGTKSEAGAV